MDKQEFGGDKKVVMRSTMEAGEVLPKGKQRHRWNSSGDRKCKS